MTEVSDMDLSGFIRFVGGNCSHPNGHEEHECNLLRCFKVKIVAKLGKLKSGANGHKYEEISMGNRRTAKTTSGMSMLTKTALPINVRLTV